MSVVLLRNKEVPQVEPNQIQLGKLKGRGSFNHIYEVKSFNVIVKGKNSIRRSSCHANTASSPSHAIVAKLPRQQENPNKFKESLENLKLEAKILSLLSHENIIQLHGVSNNRDKNSETNTSEHPPFLIMLDYLQCTLEDVVKGWSESKIYESPTTVRDKRLSFSEGCATKSTTSIPYSFKNCITILLSVSSALKYLHKHNILHRDIKPENIGFDLHGVVKVFDFGLAVELNTKNLLEDGTYNLKGGVGTCRYMAPEVASYEPYNLAADVYSFSILMYGLLTRTRPFQGFCQKKWAKKVVVEGKRPSLTKIDYHPEVRNLIRQCWDKNWKQRPNFEAISSLLNTTRLSYTFNSATAA